MSLKWNTLRAMPSLPNYARAAAYEAGVKPMRGRKLKPLGRRTHTHQTIERLADGSICICIPLWNGHVSPPGGPPKDTLIHYRVDGTIVLAGTHGSARATECEIIDHVLGWNVHSKHGKMWVETTQGAVPVASGLSTAFRPNSARYCKPDPLQPHVMQVHAIDRKGIAVARARYGNFLKFARGMSKLRNLADNPLTHDELVNMFGTNKYGYVAVPACPGDWNWKRSDLLTIQAHMLSDEPVDQMWAYMLFARHGKNMATRLTNAIIALHPDEALKLVEHTDGKVRKDNYLWVFKQN